ncbi:hypothetical protein FB45DRAFT_40738 [Roridomyces roridus]|uniref:Uncharacterized protein n=1 Tax=Roridomyces roridus TaxID=1738132 RepID=A0AAD7BRE9_9AGAR|nr:hypothetical protein FB45DRAFT_40738 [Roridomyces roridus]
MSSSRSLKQKPLSYGDAVCVLTELEGDLKDACQNLAVSTAQLMRGFNSISTQLHSVDMQATMPPVKPQWKLIRKDYTDLALQMRTNASTISARIKMFYTVILPLCTRPSQSSRSHREKLHVLQSYMAISAEQAALTFQLVDKAAKLNTSSSNFHADIARATSQRAQSGQRELQDLAQKIGFLQTNVQNLFSGTSKLSCPDVTFVAFAAFRVVAATGRQSSKTKLARYQLALNADLSQMANLFQELDGTRNQIAHAQYTTQISHRKSDALSTARIAISDLVPSQISTLETTLSLFMAVWLRLQADCLDIFNWVTNNREPPPCISAYLRGGYTIYSVLAGSLDSYAEAMDLEQFSST